MPFYRTPFGVVHLKMAKGKAPASCCARVALGGLNVPCRAIAPFLCDHVNSDGKTCDAPLCEEHATLAGPDFHLCPLHVKQRSEAAS
jgi:hypothetical protein